METLKPLGDRAVQHVLIVPCGMETVYLDTHIVLRLLY